MIHVNAPEGALQHHRVRRFGRQHRALVFLTPASLEHCFHCREPLGRDAVVQSVCGVDRRFCCGGCSAIAQMIDTAGLAEYYDDRTEAAARAVTHDARWEHYDVPGSVPGITGEPGGMREVSLILDGIRCASCVRLIERYLRRQAGIVSAHVNFATHRARVRWDDGVIRLSTVLRTLARLGYVAHPYDAARRETLARDEFRRLLLRAALALLGMMQVMMFAVPAYVTTDGVEAEYGRLLDLASLCITAPVVLYCGYPFLAGAWRNLRTRQLGMDVPVALGIAVAFAASAWRTLTNAPGEVYYDSVTMFIALLLVARLFEMAGRRRAADALESAACTPPHTAERCIDYPATRATRSVAAASLESGDHVEVAAGAIVPADGLVVEGRSSFEEAMLTGESWPRERTTGEPVLAGSFNRESPVVVKVTAAGAATRLAAMARLVERLADERLPSRVAADAVARVFVPGLLAIAAVAGAAWALVEPARSLSVMIAVLVASCPCALSLATPAVVAAAAGSLASRRILVLREGALESLARVTHVVLDKTGTVTTGRLELANVTVIRQGGNALRCIDIAAALERGSSHPLARALRASATTPVATDIVAVPGFGVTGSVDDRRYRLGRPGWTGALADTALGAVPAEHVAVVLADDDGVLAILQFRDGLRAGAHELVRRLRARGIAVSLMSGDRGATVEAVAKTLAIPSPEAAMTPQGKRARILELQKAGAVVAMIGDGVNDAPALAAADVALSFGAGAELAQWAAAVVLLGDDILDVDHALGCARRARDVIRGNLAWAFAYNATVVPLAAFGYLTPAVAAVGMSASSLLVVGNALRLLRRAPRPARDATAREPALAT